MVICPQSILSPLFMLIFITYLLILERCCMLVLTLSVFLIPCLLMFVNGLIMIIASLYLNPEPKNGIILCVLIMNFVWTLVQTVSLWQVLFPL